MHKMTNKEKYLAVVVCRKWCR